MRYLTGIKIREHYEQGPMAGALLENYVISEIYKRELHHKTGANLYYYRDSNQNEVDLIIDRKTSKEFLEIKKTSTFKAQMIENLKRLIQVGDKAYLIYRGENLPMAENIAIQNYRDYLVDERC